MTSNVQNRPMYWSDRFSMSLKADLPADELLSLLNALKQIPGINSVSGRKRFYTVVINENANLQQLMNTVKALVAVADVERSAIRYAL